MRTFVLVLAITAAIVAALLVQRHVAQSEQHKVNVGVTTWEHCIEQHSVTYCNKGA